MLGEDRPPKLGGVRRLDVVHARWSVEVHEADHHAIIAAHHRADRPGRARRIGGELHPADLEHLGGRGVGEIRGHDVIDQLPCRGGVAIDERIEDRERHDDEVQPLAADDVRRGQERLDTARS